MPSGPTHTPYDGSAKPFAIGLKPLDPVQWIEVDDDIGRYLDEKERLWRDERAVVYAETPASLSAQTEALAMLASHLPHHHADIYRREGAAMRIGPDRLVDLDDRSAPALFRAARMVQDDLVIMRRGEDGWRLAAASLSFPSSWSLAEKFDRPLDAIHADVPAFGPGTRNAALITRIFDNLKPEQPVWRLNWSIYPDASLHHPKTKSDRGRQFVAATPPGSTFVRVERQTLRRLPETGAILFTIRIHVDPVATLAAHGEGPRLAEGLRRQLAALDDDQLAYKGLVEQRAALLAALHRISDCDKGDDR